MSKRENHGQETPELPVRPLKLLIVEDDPDHRGTVRDLLEEEGHETETASDGREALDSLRGGARPDLILLDLMMPEMSGWELLDQLKKDAELASIPVVVMTGAGARVLSSPPVAAGYLSKPLGRQRLLDAIARCAVHPTRRPPLQDMAPLASAPKGPSPSPRGGRIPWGALDVRRGDADLTGSARLAALVRFFRGEIQTEAVIRNALTAGVVTDPMIVNWQQFPVQEALDAAARCADG